MCLSVFLLDSRAQIQIALVDSPMPREISAADCGDPWSEKCAIHLSTFGPDS